MNNIAETDESNAAYKSLSPRIKERLRGIGEMRKVASTLGGVVVALAEVGITAYLVPKSTQKHAIAVRGVEVVSVENVGAVHMNGSCNFLVRNESEQSWRTDMEGLSERIAEVILDALPRLIHLANAA